MTSSVRRHHEDVAVLVDVAGVARSGSSPGSAARYASRKRSSSFQSVGDAPGGSGSLTASAPISPGRQLAARRSSSDAHVPARHRPRRRARLDRQRARCPRQLAAIGQPVSVCHQWSITGTPSFSLGPVQRRRDRSARRRGTACGSARGRSAPIVLALRVLALDRAERRRRGEERRRRRARRSTRQNAPGVRRADRLALVEDGRAAVQQRRVDDVGVPDDPADVRRRPEHLARLDAVDVRHRPARARPRGRRCRARCPSAGRSCRRCRGCRAGRSRRPARTAARLGRAPPPRPSRRRARRRARRSSCGRCRMSSARGLRARRARSPRRAAACTRRCGRPRSRTRRRRSTFGSASSMRVASSCAAKPPNTTEWTAPSRAQASIAMTASGTIGM